MRAIAQWWRRLRSGKKNSAREDRLQELEDQIDLADTASHQAFTRMDAVLEDVISSVEKDRC